MCFDNEEEFIYTCTRKLLVSERKEAAARTDVCAANFFSSVSGATSSMQETRNQHLPETRKKQKLGDKKNFPFGSNEPLFTTEIIEIHFGNGRKFSFRKLNRRVFGKNRIFRLFETLRSRVQLGSGRGPGVEEKKGLCLR